MILERAHRYAIVEGAGARVTRACDAASSEIALLPEGTIIVCAELAKGGGGVRRVRISAPAGWIDADVLGDAPAPESASLPWGEFEARHLDPAPGDQYGLVFPFTHADFEKAGAEFLTAAFHAAGTMPKDNRVREIRDYRRVDSGGASVSAAFDVDYAIDDPDLHKSLFVKMPSEDTMRKFVACSSWYGETQLAMRFAEVSLPVPVPKYYFGDCSRRTTNGILVTERVGYGAAPIEPVREKGLDRILPDAEEHYRVLTRHLVRIVAFHDRGGFGPEAESIFPFGKRRTGPPNREIDLLIEFLSEIAPHLFPEAMQAPDFVARLRRDGMRILDNQKALADWIVRDVDYTGFCHANLNLDNAWFWRDAEGALQAGLIDWGYAGQMSLGQAFQGMLFASDPEGILERRHGLVDLFVEEYAQESGTRLDAPTLLEHARVASLLSLPLVIYAVTSVLEHSPKEVWQSIPDWSTPPVAADSGLGTLLSMVSNILMEWTDEVSPASILDRVLEAEGASAGD